MMKFFSMFLGVIMSILSFFSTFSTFTPGNAVHTDYEGVYISVDEIENVEGEMVANVTWHNESDDTVCYGLGYKVEFYNGESWESVQFVDIAIPEIACILEPGQSNTHSYRLKYFNFLRSGTYRISTEFCIENSDLGAIITYNTFEVENIVN